jgi:hypothetical protein
LLSDGGARKDEGATGNEVPEGECTCPPLDGPCDYCQAMNLWAHEVLYGAEDDCCLAADERDEWDDEDEDEDAGAEWFHPNDSNEARVPPKGTD